MEATVLNGVFVVLTLTVALVAICITRRCPATPTLNTTGPWRRRIGLSAVVAVVVYSLVRDTGVVLLLRANGVMPWFFVLVDLASMVPYLVASRRIVRAIAEGRVKAMLGWASCLSFGVLAPMAYVPLALHSTGRQIVYGVAAYLFVVVFGAIWARHRKAATARRAQCPSLSVLV